jgi:phosphate starvation-inducible protein PhoH
MLKPKKSKKSSCKVSCLNFELKKIQPMTANQGKVFDLYNGGKNLVLYGSAGAGKSFLSLYLGLKEMLDYGTFSKIIILRSAVASRDLGFLPGTEKEKVAVYETPYKSIINDLFGRADAYEILKQKNIVEFESTSFLRGLTYSDCLIFVDEMENMSFQELNTIYTRIGDNTKIIFAGDIKQCDLNTRKEVSGMNDFLSILTKLEEFDTIEFTIDDCVRSEMVKNYLRVKESLGL